MNTNNILAELADFDIKYAKYVYCNGGNRDGTDATQSCTDADSDPTRITDAYNKLISQGENGANLQRLKLVAANIKDSTLDITQDEYDKNVKDLILQHQNILALRRSLDDKMQVLYNLENTNYKDNNLKYDATVYSGIIWTVLASSIVYYMFTKL